LAFCTSVGLHGVAYASLSPAARELVGSHEVSQMNFELPPLPQPEPPEPPAPSVTAERASPPATPATRTPVVKPAATPTAPAPSTATTAAPALDLSGVTLTNDSGAGFAMPIGDGSALHGPIGLGTTRTQTAPAPSAAASVTKRPALVDVSDLSERPRPPALTHLLRQNYPEEARQRGLRGSASLRARIDADGVIRSARLLSESAAGFGSACRRTVFGSHWSAPRDKNGSAVATEIVYTCHFEVDQ
jgi:TonB family protein